MSGANWLDVGILSLLFGSMIFGLMRGFVRELISLLTWVGCLSAAVVYYENLSAWFTLIRVEIVRNALAFALIVLLILMIGGVIHYFVARLIKITRFKTADRTLGLFFGVIRGIILAALPVMVLKSAMFEHHELPTEAKEAVQKSMTLPYIDPIAVWLRQKMPADLKKDWLFQKKGATERKETEKEQKAPSFPPYSPV